jgi:hypothetical protein
MSSTAVAVALQQTNLKIELDLNNNLACDVNGGGVKGGQLPSFVKKEKVIITSISKTNLYIRGLDECKPRI